MLFWGYPVPMTDPWCWYINANIYHHYTPNVSIYTIHGSYGVCCNHYLTHTHASNHRIRSDPAQEYRGKLLQAHDTLQQLGYDGGKDDTLPVITARPNGQAGPK